MAIAPDKSSNGCTLWLFNNIGHVFLIEIQLMMEIYPSFTMS